MIARLDAVRANQAVCGGRMMRDQIADGFDRNVRGQPPETDRDGS